MKIYSTYGVNDFIICCGYKGYVIKEYFANYFLHMSDVTFDMQNNRMDVHHKHAEPWQVTLVDTGDDTQTSGRLKRVQDYLGHDTACFTYGDGLSDVNIADLLAFHRRQGRLATVTAVQPPGRYGALHIQDEQVMQFQEKPDGDGAWINGGYFVVEPGVLDLIDRDSTSWESDTLPLIASQGQLTAFRHYGFWQAMDTLRDKTILENLWQSGSAPWKVW